MGLTARDKIVAARRAEAETAERDQRLREQSRLYAINSRADAARTRMLANLGLDDNPELISNTDIILVDRFVSPELIATLGDPHETAAVRLLVGRWEDPDREARRLVVDRVRLTGLDTEFTVRYRVDYEAAPDDFDDLTWYATLYDGDRKITALTDIDPGPGPEPERATMPYLKFQQLLDGVCRDLLTKHNLSPAAGSRETYPHDFLALSAAYSSRDEKDLVQRLAGLAADRGRGPGPYVAKTTYELIGPVNTTYHVEYWVERNSSARTLDDLTFHAHLYRDGQLIGTV